jgi:galactose mutarotase-like enzyme
LITQGPRFGRFATISLENDAVRIVACPDLGARILSLLDRRSGREWLVGGEPPSDVSAWAGEDAVFGGREAFGWDECLPTVAPCPDPLNPDGPPLRDHGECWGRPAEVTGEGDVLVARWRSSRWDWALERRLRLEGATVEAAYRIENRGSRPLPFLWSIHPLLALEPDSTVELVQPAEVRITAAIGFDRPPEPPPDRWTVADITAGTALKAYARMEGAGKALARQPDSASLRMEWDLVAAPVAGVWLDFGGWPAEAPVHQVAIEPTTSEDDDLCSAIAASRAKVVEAGEAATWSVRMILG